MSLHGRNCARWLCGGAGGVINTYSGMSLHVSLAAPPSVRSHFWNYFGDFHFLSGFTVSTDEGWRLLTWGVQNYKDSCIPFFTGKQSNDNNPTQGREFSTAMKKNFSIIISRGFKVNDQCTVVSKKASIYMMLCLTFRNLYHESPEVMKRLYTPYVRSHLAPQFLLPNCVKDQNSLERVHRRAARQITTLRILSYDERLNRLKMFSLQKRRWPET